MATTIIMTLSTTTNNWVALQRWI